MMTTKAGQNIDYCIRQPRPRTIHGYTIPIRLQASLLRMASCLIHSNLTIVEMFDAN